MGWFMPSYKRPHRMRELLAAPGGWPSKVVVLVNLDQIGEYYIALRELPITSPWKLLPIPEDSFCADAHREISTCYPNEDFYGLLMDDLWPITPGWHSSLETAAGRMRMSVGAGPRGVLCLGGDLVRAMGSLVPAPVKHHFEDDIWHVTAETHGLFVSLPDVVVEHRHYMYGTAPKDETYDRSQVNTGADSDAFTAWKVSADRAEMDVRIRARALALGKESA